MVSNERQYKANVYYLTQMGEWDSKNKKPNKKYFEMEKAKKKLGLIKKSVKWW